MRAEGGETARKSAGRHDTGDTCNFDSLSEHSYHLASMQRGPSGLPEYFDPARLADEGAHLEGDIPIGQLPRLAAMCARPEGSAHVAMDFERSTDGVRLMRLHGQARGVFQCGRCLGDVTVAWRADNLLVIHRSADDDTDVLIADGPVLLRSVVEDELLLTAPMFPAHSHPCGETDTRRDGESPAARGPFATLARLKKGRR